MDCQKHLFSIRPEVHYLNCAYKAPLLKAAEKASIGAIVRERNPMDIAVDDFFVETEEVRTYFGKLVNCKPSNVALIPSTSYGFSTVLNNIKGKFKGKAITVKDEFPSGYFSLMRWCRFNQNDLVVVGPDVDLVQVGENWNTKILENIDEQTSVVLISSVHWMNGLRFDLKSIGEKCRKVGAKFIVDGTQSVGALSIDIDKYKIDALICASYKWLLGSYSIALAYISDQFENGQPLEESWLNRTNARNFSALTDYETDYQPKAGRYNVGETSNFILMPILKEALRQINEWTVEAIESYCQKLIIPLINYLKEIGVDLEEPKYFSNHLFSLKLPKSIDREKLQKNLKDNNVFISVRANI